MDKVLVYLVTTESHDHFVFVFEQEPSKERFAEVLAEELGDEAEWVSSVTEFWEKVHKGSLS